MSITCPQCGYQFTQIEASMDGRAVKWRIRVRLYDMRRDPPELEADTEGDNGDQDAAGTMICLGLPGVAETLRDLAAGFHSSPVMGLDMEALRHRLKALRPTLSRRKGNAVWRVPYEVAATFNGDPVKYPWMARVDIEKVET